MPHHVRRHGPYGHDWGWRRLILLWAVLVWAVPALAAVHMLPLLAVIAILALMRLRQARGPRLRAAPARLAIEAPGPSALEVLRERYALGEIDLFTFADTVELVLAAEVEGYSTATQYA